MFKYERNSSLSGNIVIKKGRPHFGNTKTRVIYCANYFKYQIWPFIRYVTVMFRGTSCMLNIHYTSLNKIENTQQFFKHCLCICSMLNIHLLMIYKIRNNVLNIVCVFVNLLNIHLLMIYKIRNTSNIVNVFVLC